MRFATDFDICIYGYKYKCIYSIIYGNKYKYIFGSNNDCIDNYTSVILPDCWIGKDQDNHEEVKDLLFIVQQF